MQIWKKLGSIFSPEGNLPDHQSYAAVPFITAINGDIARIYFTARSTDNKSLMYYLDFNLETKKTEYLCEQPVIEPGEPGFFDEDGVMGCDSQIINGKQLIYYIGWNRANTVPFRNAIGLAELKEDKIHRIFTGPVLDRSPYDPCFVASCCVLPFNGEFIMYYLSCIDWKKAGEQWSHRYHIKIALSKDGQHWTSTGKTAIDFKYKNEYAISVPRVIREENLYRMWYSFRGGPASPNYQIGYAESTDGFNWTRKDEQIRFEGEPLLWESEMQCYPYVFKHKSEYYMLYNGNGYGKTGFGLAVLLTDSINRTSSPNPTGIPG